MPISTTEGFSVQVEGLEPLLAALDRIEPATKVELHRELLQIAEHVAELGRQFAVGEGLVDDEHAPPGGGLADRIKPRASGSRVLVVDTARRSSPRYPGGYSYPARYEFESGGARSFFRPAVKVESSQTAYRLQQLFARIEREAGI